MTREIETMIINIFIHKLAKIRGIEKTIATTSKNNVKI